MSKREDEAYTIFINEMKAQFPDAAGALDALSGTSAGREIYRGGLREDEFNRRMNKHNDEVKQFELDRIAKQEKYDEDVKELRTWFEREKPKNAQLESERQRLQQELQNMKGELVKAGFEVPAQVDQVVNAVSNRGVDANELAELRQRYDALDRGLPHMFAASIEIARRSIRDGFDMNPADVIAYAAKNNKDPLEAYDFVTKPQREAAETKQRQVELQKARDEGAREALSKLQGPDRIRPSSPSVVEALRGQQAADAAPIFDQSARRDAAVRDFIEMTNSKA